MCILAVLSVVSSRLILSAGDQYLTAAAHAELSGEMNAAMERIATQLRQIPATAGSSGTVADLASVSPSAVAWTDDNNGAASFAMQASTLYAVETGAVKALLKGVTVFSVKAYDAGGAALGANLTGAGCEAVQRLEITMTATRSGVTESLRTRIFLRATMSGSSV